jgi:hypothetical protein
MEQLKRRNGVNIKKYCAEHEAYVEIFLDGGDDPAALLALHARKILWLQHERLIHLIVLLLFSVLFLFSVGLYVAVADPLALVLTAVALATVGAYIRHYFILENKVQYWYTLYDEIYSRLK